MKKFLILPLVVLAVACQKPETVSCDGPSTLELFQASAKSEDLLLWVERDAYLTSNEPAGAQDFDVLAMASAYQNVMDDWAKVRDKMDLKYTLKNIRLTEADNSTKTLKCVADVRLNLNGQETEVNYDVSLISDDTLYVKVNTVLGL